MKEETLFFLLVFIFVVIPIILGYFIGQWMI